MVRTLDRGEEMHSSLFKREPKFAQSNLRPDSAKSPNHQQNMNCVVFSNQLHQFREDEENFMTMGVYSRGLNFQRSQQEHQRQQQMQQAGLSQHRSANGSTLLNVGTNSEIFQYPSLAQESPSWKYQDQDMQVSNGLVYQPNMMQSQRLINLEHQQFDQSLYGVPVSSSRCLPATHDSQGKPDRSSMCQPQISINSSYCNGDPHNLLTDRLRNESSIPRHNFHSQNVHQVAHPNNEVALDPEEERILYGSDDNIWDAFGTTNIAEESVNIFGNGGSSNGLASIQSGSWSALMLSAVAETSSINPTLQVLTSAGKQKSSNQLFTEVSAPSKFLYHPMGNVINDMESEHNLQQPAQVRAIAQQNVLFGHPNIFGRAATNSTASRTAQSREIPGDAERESSNRNASHQALTVSSSISQPTETRTSKNSSSSSQNKLELLHKVDQEKDHTYMMQTMSVEDKATNQSSDAENSRQIHQPLRTQSSVSQGFGLHITTPFQHLQHSQNDQKGNANSSYKIPGKHNIASSRNMPEQAGNNGVREGLIPTSMSIEVKRESSQHDFQHSAKTVQSIWTKVLTYSNGGQCQMLQSQTAQSPYQNILESSSTPSTEAVEEPKLKENTSHLSKSVSADHVPKVKEPLGKEPHMKHHFEDPPENSTSTHKEIKCFGQIFRPSSFSDQPHYLPNETQALSNAHKNVINGETKIMEGPDNLADATLASINQSKPNSVVEDPLSSTTAIIIPEASKVMTLSGTVHIGQKKHKIDMFRLRPWHKEISDDSHDRSTCSTDEAEGVEDSTPMLKYKKRLIRSSQLVHQLIGSPPASTLSVDVRSCYDVVSYSISRTVLGDAFSCVTNHSNSLNPPLEIHKPLVRNGAHEKAYEELSRRTKRVKTQLQKLEKSASSLLDLRLECGDLEKFSIMNRLGRMHAETASTNTSSAKKPPPQRYCIAKLMPKDFPKSVECLSL